MLKLTLRSTSRALGTNHRGESVVGVVEGMLNTVQFGNGIRGGTGWQDVLRVAFVAESCAHIKYPSPLSGIRPTVVRMPNSITWAGQFCIEDFDDSGQL